jgi:hypothetical protein
VTVRQFPRRPQHTYRKPARDPSVPHTTVTQPQGHETFQFPRRISRTGRSKDWHVGISGLLNYPQSELTRQFQNAVLGPRYRAHPAEDLGVNTGLEDELIGRRDGPSDVQEEATTTDKRSESAVLFPSTVRKAMLERELTPALRDSLLRDHYFAYQTGRASKKRQHPETLATTKSETPAPKESSDDFFHEYFAEQLSRAW